MSEIESDNREKLSKVGGRISGPESPDHQLNNGDDQEDDEDDQSSGGPKENKNKNKKKKRRGYRFNCGFSKAKLVVQFPISRAKKFLKNCKQKLDSSSSSADATSSGNCCFCLKQSLSLESPAESITSDPNDCKYTFEMLKTLIETNDFCLKECNTHLD